MAVPLSLCSVLTSYQVLLRKRILVAQQSVRRLVLFNGGEAAHGRAEAVVGVVIVALADLAQ